MYWQICLSCAEHRWMSMQCLKPYTYFLLWYNVKILLIVTINYDDHNAECNTIVIIYGVLSH